MTERHNLLTEPIFTVDSPEGAREHRSLPAVLDRLARGAATDFGALQAHQLQSWESFLIQLGALATVANGGALPDSEDAWRAALRALTGGDDAGWCLVGDDITKPAFMQPPIAGKDFRDPKEAMEASDLFDMLVTSKNHDLKRARAARSRPEHWVFALVNLQTTDGYPGRGNYGIARMNGGLGSRPSVGLTATTNLASRFRRDIALWIRRRGSLIEDFGFRDVGGLALLWTAPWDGNASIATSDIDPLFIEVCRRIRLGTRDDLVRGWSAPSTVPRVDAKERKGELGDIWIPIKRGDERTAFTAGENGFSYKVVSELLLGEKFDHAPAMLPQDGESGELLLLARVLVRGQGKTNGLHERVLPIPVKVRPRLFGGRHEREAVGKLAKERVDDVAKVQNKVLHVALCALLQAAAEGQKLDLTDDRTQRWKRVFDERIDAIFFEELWADLDLAASDPNAARLRWQWRVIQVAKDVFDDAVDAVPLPSVRAYRARAVADRMFTGCAYKNFREAMQTRGAEMLKEVSP